MYGIGNISRINFILYSYTLFKILILFYLIGFADNNLTNPLHNIKIMKTAKEFNRAIILAAIEDCRDQKYSGKSRYEIERGLIELGLPLDLCLFISAQTLAQ